MPIIGSPRPLRPLTRSAPPPPRFAQTHRRRSTPVCRRSSTGRRNIICNHVIARLVRSTRNAARLVICQDTDMKPKTSQKCPFSKWNRPEPSAEIYPRYVGARVCDPQQYSSFTTVHYFCEPAALSRCCESQIRAPPKTILPDRGRFKPKILQKCPFSKWNRPEPSAKTYAHPCLTPNPLCPRRIKPKIIKKCPKSN